MDALDVRIIGLLQKDARASNAELGRQLGVSEETVRRRTKRLLEENVMRIVSVTDPAKLGYGLEALVGIKVSPGAVDVVADALAGLDEVGLVFFTTGSFDIFIRVALRSTEALRGFLSDRVRGIPGVLTIETFVTLEMKKQSYGVPTS